MKSIKVIGAKGHNLKNITVEIPKDKMVVVTGPVRQRQKFAGL